MVRSSPAKDTAPEEPTCPHPYTPKHMEWLDPEVIQPSGRFPGSSTQGASTQPTSSSLQLKLRPFLYPPS